MEAEKDKVWSPYLAGGLSGVVSILSAWIVGKFFGASTSYVRSAAMIERVFAPERVEQMSYFLKYAPKIDWQWMFVWGVLVGSLIASVTSRSFHWQAVPDMWQKRFGPGGILRALTAFIGGVTALFGARMAGGCPSGHGLSGVMQLSVSGLIALICFFAGGILTARVLYGGGERG